MRSIFLPNPAFASRQVLGKNLFVNLSAEGGAKTKPRLAFLQKRLFDPAFAGRRVLGKNNFAKQKTKTKFFSLCLRAFVANIFLRSKNKPRLSFSKNALSSSRQKIISYCKYIYNLTNLNCTQIKNIYVKRNRSNR
jgi:hypothetical protein